MGWTSPIRQCFCSKVAVFDAGETAARERANEMARKMAEEEAAAVRVEKQAKLDSLSGRRATWWRISSVSLLTLAVNRAQGARDFGAAKALIAKEHRLNAEAAISLAISLARFRAAITPASSAFNLERSIAC